MSQRYVTKDRSPVVRVAGAVPGAIRQVYHPQDEVCIHGVPLRGWFCDECDQQPGRHRPWWRFWRRG